MFTFGRVAPIAALLLLYVYFYVKSNDSLPSISLTLMPAHGKGHDSVSSVVATPSACNPAALLAAQAQSQSTAGEGVDAGPAPTRSPHRDFCNVTAAKPGPEEPNRALSHFTEKTNACLRAAAVAVADAGGDAAPAAAKAELQAQLAPYADSAKCYWAEYHIPNWVVPRELYPFCTHDPSVDVLISAFIHKSQAWFGFSVYQDLKGIFASANGTCPPDRPVMLDLGLNIGSFAMYGVEVGCHVIGFDGLSANVNRVVQTMTRAVGKDGRPFIERFHGYVNVLGNHVGNMTMSFLPNNPGASKVQGSAQASQPGEETVHAVIVDDLFVIPEAQRPQIKVGKKNDAGRWEYAMQALRREHVYFVKIDVESYEFLTIHGLRRLLEGAIRPAGLFIEIATREASHFGCDVKELARFLYSLGYVYVPVEGIPKGKAAEAELDALLAEIEEMITCPSGCPSVLESWWVLHQ